MKLPAINVLQGTWSHTALAAWPVLRERAETLRQGAGSSDAFEQMLMRIKRLLAQKQRVELYKLLSQRLAARALTAHWLDMRKQGVSVHDTITLEALVAAQQPRLTRLTLLQLAELYFAYFDQLDKQDELADGVSFRMTLEKHLHHQVSLMPVRAGHGEGDDFFAVLRREGAWMLSKEGPAKLVERVRSSGGELQAAFSQFAMEGYDGGRYGDICRASFYLDTLREVQEGDWHEVMDELLKPDVSQAPYEGDKCIGHAAMEILIDRTKGEISEAWQNFLLTLAGDPRIASTSKSYMKWWHPLGEARVQQVRGWLSKEDLKLFLQAVEEYGRESDNRELQRMFAARKVFLDGLFKLKLVRQARLMLGGAAERMVRRILADEIKTNFAKLDGSNLSDKAIIYLDCGDFCIVEGSHSFKIWVYLAKPNEALASYDKTKFSHFDLTHKTAARYSELYPGLPYRDIAHLGTWQHSVISFLAENGVGLDLEVLLTASDYRVYRQRFGLPVISARKPSVEPVTPLRSDVQLVASRDAESMKEDEFVLDGGRSGTSAGEAIAEALKKDEVWTLLHLSESDLAIVSYFFRNPGDRTRHAANVLGHPAHEINLRLYGPLKPFLVQKMTFGWHVKNEVVRLLQNKGLLK